MNPARDGVGGSAVAVGLVKLDELECGIVTSQQCHHLGTKLSAHELFYIVPKLIRVKHTQYNRGVESFLGRSLLVALSF